MVRRLLLSLLTLSLGYAQAKDATTPLTFGGALIAPPVCSVNSGNEVDVDFGPRVGVNKIDGKAYMTEVNYRISCVGDGSPWAMTLTLAGVAAAFDPTVLATDQTGLGIRFSQAGQPFELNTPLSVQDPANPPLLQAVPVKQSGATLTEGNFEARATLLALYQ